VTDRPALLVEVLDADPGALATSQHWREVAGVLLLACEQAIARGLD